MKLSEIAITTGDVAFGIGTQSHKPKSKTKKKSDDYDNDPVTGVPQKNRKKIGKVLLSGDLEEAKKSKKSKKIETEENILDKKWIELETILDNIRDKSLSPDEEWDRRQAHRFLSKLHSLGRTLDSDSKFVYDIEKLWKLKRDPSAAFAQPTFYDPVGYGLIKPKGVPQGRLERLLDTVWYIAIVEFTNMAKDMLGMAETLRDNRIVLDKVLNDKENSLENYYQKSVNNMNIKLAPQQQAGPPQMGIHKGERLSDLCPCRKCKTAKSYKEMCRSGQEALARKPLGSMTKSLADVGLERDPSGYVHRVEPKGRRIRPE